MAYRITVEEVDSGTIDAFRAQVDQAIGCSEDGGGDVELDVTAVTFMDSAGLHVLTQAHKVLSARGRRLRLVDPSPSVRRLLEITGMAEAML